MNPLTLLPARVRYAVYVAYGLVGIVLGGATGYFSALHLAAPDWLTGSQGVYLALAAPFGVLAASNTDRTKAQPPDEPDQDGIDRLPALPEDGDQ